MSDKNDVYSLILGGVTLGRRGRSGYLEKMIREGVEVEVEVVDPCGEYGEFWRNLGGKE